MGACKVDIEVLTAELVRYIDDELTSLIRSEARVRAFSRAVSREGDKRGNVEAFRG